MKALRFALTHARREGRAAPRRIILLAATVALGIAALTAINGFTANLRQSIRDQSRALLGADIRLGSRTRFSPVADSLLGVAAKGGDVARVVSFDAMAYAPTTRATRLVDVEAIGAGWPFYGTVRTDPAEAWSRLTTGHVIIVDPSLLASLGVKVGDSVSIGKAKFEVAGTVVEIPGDVTALSAFAPSVYVPVGDAEATGLLGFGARLSYDAYIKLPVGSDVKAAANGVRAPLRTLSISVRTASDDERDLNDSLTKLARYLGLVALAALLLGGIGVASASRELITRRLESIAVLRCLGAPAGTVLLAYLLEAGMIGLVGGIIGVAAGTALQLSVPALLHGMIPVNVHVAADPATIVLGIGLGIWVTMVFALGPLLGIRRVPPLAALRRDAEELIIPRDAARWGARLLLALSVLLLAALQVRSLIVATGFSVALAVAAGSLALVAAGLVRLARLTPARLPYTWRQGLANLHRPANQTASVILALGFGAFVLLTLFLTERSLLSRFAIDTRPDRPDLVFFDIQPDQVDGVRQILKDGGATPASFTPIVPMRIKSLKGSPVTALLTDSTRPARGERPGWALRREYRSTWRDTATASERVTDGRWWHAGAGRAAGAVPISVEEGLANTLGVTVGDTITWDVQGADVVTRVANLRHVEWTRFEPNFFVVFPAGPVDRAPQTLVALTRGNTPAARAALQAAVVSRYSNISAIDASVLADAIARLVSRIALAVRFLALFTLAAGAAVLVGAVAASRRQRLREGVLLKTLGATRAQVMRIAVVEYAALGLLAAVAASGLAIAGAALLARSRFELPLVVPGGALAAVAAGLAALSVIVGLWTGREVFSGTALEELRGE
ncbi:MAG TPA: FtsX-like permease family protein [Gemmatimonadales bacterium]|nr:FtsX-like permease family protein [Gemmatimonadales bacterium]